MTASSLRNMTGQRKLQMRTPIETITRNVPNVQHLRICAFHVGYFNRTQNNLERRGREGHLLRCMTHRLYRIMDLQSRKVLNMRHVSLHETKFPRHERNKHMSEAKLDKIEDEVDPIYVMKQNASEGGQDESGNAIGIGTVSTWSK